jgi:hypothetical protein
MDIFLHITVGAALAALVCWNHWFMVLATFVYASLREQAQHRYILENWSTEEEESDWGHKVYKIEKRTFFDFRWMTGHRLWEVFQWTLGAAAVCLGYQLIYV